MLRAVPRGCDARHTTADKAVDKNRLRGGDSTGDHLPKLLQQSPQGNRNADKHGRYTAEAMDGVERWQLC